VSVYADGGSDEHNPFTVPRRVLVPRIDLVDFSTSDAEPPSISSLRRLLLVVIFSSSSSHARTAFEGMRLRLVVGAVTPNGPVNGVIVAVEVAALLVPPLLLLFMLVTLLRTEERVFDALRCRVGGMERASGVCERRFDVVRLFLSAVMWSGMSSCDDCGIWLKTAMSSSGEDDTPGVGIGGVSGPTLELLDVDGEREGRRDDGADFERDAFFFVIFSRAIERCSCESGASLISIGSKATSTGPDADMRVTFTRSSNRI